MTTAASYRLGTYKDTEQNVDLRIDFTVKKRQKKRKKTYFRF